MSTLFAEDTPLARLRDDLEVSPGEPFLSGAPSWIIYDPVRHRFFQIGKFTIDVLAHWSVGTVTRLKESMLANKAIALGDEDLEEVTEFLRRNQLLEGGDVGTATRFASAVKKGAFSALWSTAQKSLVWRIPVVRPQGFLDATWPIVMPFFTRGFVFLTTFVLLIALYLAGRQASEIGEHFRQVYSFEGALVFVLAIAFVKILHELGHAYQAVARGLQVPIMGVAIFVFFPLLYTDVNDAHRLRNRRDRVMVDLGGVLVEVFLAVYATLLWCFLPDGAARTAAFAIATTSWLSSIFINLNPFLRFDGYYLLSDSLGISNFQSRSFALGKWSLRRMLFALDDPVPEELGRATRLGMTTYAYATWVYRLFLSGAIAFLVYQMFFKLAGVLLLTFALALFVAKPVLAEVRYWFANRQRILCSRRTLLTFSTLLLVFAVFLWPISTRMQLPAILEQSRQKLLFPPEAATLEEVYIEVGDHVSIGDPLFRFSVPELSTRIEQSKLRIGLHEARLLSAAGDELERAEGSVVVRILEEELENLSALQDRQNSLLVLAASDGEVRELSSGLKVGAEYPRDHILGLIIEDGPLIVRGYVSEADVSNLDLSNGGDFVADEPLIPRVRLNAIEVSNYSIDRLADGYLSSESGGPIEVTRNELGESLVSDVWYPMTALLTSQDLSSNVAVHRVHPGVVTIHSKNRSLASRIGSRVAQVLIREMDF